MYEFQIAEYRKQKREVKSVGYWKGFQSANKNECNFYVEKENGVERYYNGKDKRHEYRNVEPYDLIRDHTLKSHQERMQPQQIDQKIVTLEEATEAGDQTKATTVGRPNVSQDVKQSNANRFKELTTPAGEKAKALLSNGGLNHTSFTKSLGMDGKNMAAKRKTKPIYDAIIKELEDNDLVKLEKQIRRNQ